jgi:hypothetical protein
MQSPLSARRRILACATAFAAVIALAGCTVGSSPVVTVTASDAPSESPSASLSPSPVPTATPDATPEAPPAETTTNNADGALAAAQLFAQEYPRILTGGDYDLWDSMTLPGCVFCAEARSLAQAYRDEGVNVRGGRVDILVGPAEAVIDADGTAHATFFATEETLWVSEPGRGEHPAVPASESRFLVELAYVDGAWRVSAMEIQRQEI